LSENSYTIAQRVQAARDIQSNRFAGETISTNSQMSLQLVKKYCKLDDESRQLLDKAIDRFHLSARAYIRILKLSRTIADLSGAEHILQQHISEALQYRGKI
jgi:magnesium chelatase family protein